MTAPQCVAECCAGVPADRTGLCTAHRRSLTLSTKMQDAVREFLHGNLKAGNVIRPTTENAPKVIEAGALFAQGLALLISTAFDSEIVSYDGAPIVIGDLRRNQPPWRVSFAWKATINHTTWNDNDETDDDDELDESLEVQTP